MARMQCQHGAGGLMKTRFSRLLSMFTTKAKTTCGDVVHVVCEFQIAKHRNVADAV